jgi:hypothetical protein
LSPAHVARAHDQDAEEGFLLLFREICVTF